MNAHANNILQKTSRASMALAVLISIFSCSPEPEGKRKDILLNSGWKTIANDSLTAENKDFKNADFNTSNWLEIDVPHNWDSYHGYLRKVHGNYHGYAWYRKQFSIEKQGKDARYFLFFEGVGSYATVWLNGNKVGQHAGGRTTFTLDITPYINFGKTNLLAVRADHPSGIRDLPWVCGGCSTEVGFSEGSQPLGIFRPVHLIVTNKLRVEPFGVNVWNDTTVTEEHAELHITAEIKNYGKKAQTFTIKNILKDTEGNVVASSTDQFSLAPREVNVFENTSLQVNSPKLWSLETPYLYKLHTQIEVNGKMLDEEVTPYGIRWISWPVNRNDSSNQFLLNGKPVFINGVGEYEHMLGNSHAFTDEQIKARVGQIRAAGFNAFRDAHQPHNLRYQAQFDSLGILWWTQMSAHIWFDTPEFRENFKTLLHDWVKERRNNPSNMVWGLQNESTIPKDVAEEYMFIISKMDPTTSTQRIVTTCNGGSGTDWNVIQNWSGTYGGNPHNYANEISDQLLNGEYGAWRSLDLHTEGAFNQNGALSEDRMAQLLEIKVQQAESVRDKCCGQFLWVFSSHDNPGRIQSGEAYRDIDRVGPVNYKGLQTPWGEPLDAYYMYQSHYTNGSESPMVYIVSHTWPNRWKSPGVKESITVYSNCDEVELFNDVDGQSLGKMEQKGPFEPFVWKKANIKYNILKAKGYINGEKVAEDIIVLQNLPQSPNFDKIYTENNELLQPEAGNNYVYRVNCGGSKYIDSHGNTWEADRQQTSTETWGSLSWTDKFDNLPAYYGSQRRTFDPIKGTKDWKLFQEFRFGLKELEYNFPLPNGQYTVELYFEEPWYGTGSNADCSGWRLFDIALNDSVVTTDFDIWKEAGHNNAVKKQYTVQVEQGKLKIHFPKVKSGQAIISAIAISTKDGQVKPSVGSSQIVENLIAPKGWSIETWADIGQLQYAHSSLRFNKLPSNLFAATWIKTNNAPQTPVGKITFTVNKEVDLFVALDENITHLPTWLSGYSRQDSYLENNALKHNKYIVYSKRFKAGSQVELGANGKGANMYTVFVQAASSLGAPTDQRPVKEYSSAGADIKGNAELKTENGRWFVEIKTNDEVEITWDFYVGLASNYGVHFKFQNNTKEAVHPVMLIETAGGIKMSEKEIEMYHRPGKWRTVKANTGTTINAGDYRVTLKLKNAKGLLIQRMEIQ